jgi:hypothetical protein
MAPPIEYMPTMGFGAEAIYSFVIIVCSLMIYFGTKELYHLSSHKGIKYFRQAFLFFAIAYFFRSFIKFVLDYLRLKEISEFAPRFFGGGISLFFFMYFSSMAIFYLLYSVVWKKWNNDSTKIYLFHFLSLIIATIVLILKNTFVYFIMNIILLLFVTVVFYIVHKNNKKKENRLYATYALLFIFEILNVIDILIPAFFQGIQLFVYLASSGIFLIILYKVLRKIGN